ncbi:hypothetical protein GCK72_007773 [Caenorhabditis remanei]|uniref:DUF38 domain-containing protein n=1 Tax=Caenorhabditis remanei TaxID=31234 RepID=A0A6A5HMI4_CAERE|nr:hypothetical protein GCK72_007773 [Caenorhabditis remanei]KAF1767814.1 hypothetical protein GCK72_007773 [Caenorhabditis remanei]
MSSAHPQRALSNSSVKSILKHMNVGTRLRMSHYIPPLRGIEAASNLAVIDHLTLERDQLIIDKTIFKIDYYDAEFSEDDENGEESSYLQVTMKSGRFCNVERLLNDNRYIPEAMQYLTKKLFGGRAPIRVRYLAIDKRGPDFFLPDDVKIVVRDIKVSHYAATDLEAFRPNMHSASFPLETVTIKGARELREDTEYYHPFIQTAKLIQILDKAGAFPWDKVILELTNSQIHLECSKFQETIIMALIEKWENRGGENGACFSMGVGCKTALAACLDKVAKREDAELSKNQIFGCADIPNMIMIPMKTQKSKIGIYVSKNLWKHARGKFFSQYDVNMAIFDFSE